MPGIPNGSNGGEAVSPEGTLHVRRLPKPVIQILEIADLTEKFSANADGKMCEPMQYP